MESRAATNGVVQTKLTRCASSVGDCGNDKTKAGWSSPREIWRNLSLRRKAEAVIDLPSMLSGNVATTREHGRQDCIGVR
ncbi:unnamed protein product, partial [Iphiclides podalirius]